MTISTATAAAAALIVILLLLLSAAASSSTAATIFQSNVDGIRVQIPNGWIVEDIDNTDPINQQREKRFGYVALVDLCPQAQTLPKIAGGYECPVAGVQGDYVQIIRFADLQSRPEFEVLARENKSITTSGLLAYFIEDLVLRTGSTDFMILVNIDRAVNVTDPQTNQTIATAPAKYVEMTYSDPHGRGHYIDFALLVLSNDGNTGYVLYPQASQMTSEGKFPPEHQQILDSFELIAAAASASTSIAASE